MASLAGMAVGALQARARSRGRSPRLAALAAKVRENLVTLAALAAMDFGAFEVWHHGGWFAVAVSLLVADWAVQG